MSIIHKLKFIKTHPVLMLNSPGGFDPVDNVCDREIKQKQYRNSLTFVKNKSEVDSLVPDLLKVWPPQAVIWMAYPKKSASIASDISRDNGWQAFARHGYRAVSQVSLNEAWSALRFKPLGEVKASAAAETKTFKAVIQGADDNSGGAWVDIPYDVEKTYGTKGQVKVKATFDDHSYSGSIANMGGGDVLIVRKDVRKAISKEVGDSVMVSIQKDSTDRTVDIPQELAELLKKNKNARGFYDSLSYTNRKEYAHWIASAKRVETKEKRLAETLDRLNKEIKNPFVKG